MAEEFVTLEGTKYKFPDPYPKSWAFVGQNGIICSVHYDGSIQLGEAYDPKSAAKAAADLFWHDFARHVALHYMAELGRVGGGGGAGGFGTPGASGGSGSGGSAGNFMGAGGGGAAPMTIYGQGRTMEPWESYTLPDGLKQVSMMIGGKRVRIEIE